jgi:excinuclease ABC subunit C
MLGASLQAMRSEGIIFYMVGLAKKEEIIGKGERHRALFALRNSLALYLIQRLRDEAHRFAITFHRESQE